MVPDGLINAPGVHCAKDCTFHATFSTSRGQVIRSEPKLSRPVVRFAVSALLKRGEHRAKGQRPIVDAVRTGTDAGRAGCVACVDRGHTVPAAWLGEATGALDSIHCSLSESHRDRIAPFVLHRVFLGFRLCDFAGARAGDEVGGSLLLCKHLCRVGVRSSLRVS